MLHYIFAYLWMDIYLDLQFSRRQQETKEVKDSTDAARKVPGLS